MNLCISLAPIHNIRSAWKTSVQCFQLGSPCDFVLNLNGSMHWKWPWEVPCDFLALFSFTVYAWRRTGNNWCIVYCLAFVTVEMWYQGQNLTFWQLMLSHFLPLSKEGCICRGESAYGKIELNALLFHSNVRWGKNKLQRKSSRGKELINLQ